MCLFEDNYYVKSFFPSREYLKSESLDKRKQSLDLGGWSDHTPKDIPVQTNSSDCGVFTCMVRIRGVRIRGVRIRGVRTRG
jgi:Ulp1 family protease